MLAFVNTTFTKSVILAQLRAHTKADQIVKGRYWENGRGCAVGCTIHSRDHAEYEPRFGIPQMLARLEDCIFEGLPNEQAQKWPVRFMSAVQPGTDLSCVGWRFLHWLLTNKEVNPGVDHPLVCDAVKQCADVLIPLTKGLPVNESAAQSAWSAARSAAQSAWSAAQSTAQSAWSAQSAAQSAESAAQSAWSAWSAAQSAESAAQSAAESAQSAAQSAWNAWGEAYIIMSDKLVALIEAAPKGSVAVTIS